MKNTINSQITFFKYTCQNLIKLLNKDINNNSYLVLNENYSLKQKEKIKQLNKQVTNLLNFNFKLVDKINNKINNLTTYKKNIRLNFSKEETSFNWNVLLFFEFLFYSNLEKFKLENIFFTYQSDYFFKYFLQFFYIYHLNEIFNSNLDQINLYEKIKNNKLENLELYEKNIDKKIDLLNFIKKKENIFFLFNKIYNEINFSNKQLSLKITYYSYNLFQTINVHNNLLKDFFLDFSLFIELLDLTYIKSKNISLNLDGLEFINNNQKFDLSLINDNVIFYINLLENKKREIKGFYKKLNEMNFFSFE